MDIEDISLVSFEDYEHDESNEITYYEHELYHCIPNEDLYEHEATVSCWCKPYPDHEISTFIIHNRFFDEVHLFTGN